MDIGFHPPVYVALKLLYINTCRLATCGVVELVPTDQAFLQTSDCLLGIATTFGKDNSEKPLQKYLPTVEKE